MARRAEQKRAARERLAQARRAQARRQRRLRVIWAAVIVVVLAGIGTGVGYAVTGRSHSTPRLGYGPSVDIGALPGLRTTRPPWPPQYQHLPERLSALRLPSAGQTEHIHAHLSVYVRGKRVTVPANIGLDAAQGIESPLHTHDTTGVVHVEARKASDRLTLGAFFDVWGVRFTDTALAAYRDNGKAKVRVYRNGKPLTNPTRYVLREHDNIIVGYGPPGSTPTSVPFTWPSGL